MTRSSWILLVLGLAERVLTHLGKREPLERAWTAKPNVSWIVKPLIFCGYETQSLDLFLNFVRMSETNLSQIGRFRFAPVVLFAAGRQRSRGRSVANWQ
jgi:hypothetical protein